jgi:hypothetical protein
MKRLLGALAVALALLTSGCYEQRGKRFGPEEVGQLQPGVSTERDAIDKFGAPSAVFNYAGGSKLLNWQYVHGIPIGTTSEARAAILFDADGKMIRVAHFSQQRDELWWNP